MQYTTPLSFRTEVLTLPATDNVGGWQLLVESLS